MKYIFIVINYYLVKGQSRSQVSSNSSIKTPQLDPSGGFGCVCASTRVRASCRIKLGLCGGWLRVCVCECACFMQDKTWIAWNGIPVYTHPTGLDEVLEVHSRRQPMLLGQIRCNQLHADKLKLSAGSISKQDSQTASILGPKAVNPSQYVTWNRTLHPLP